MNAAGILLRARDTKRYLFLQQERDGVWVTPGGHIERGETPVRAAIRELAEETGYYGEIEIESEACAVDGYVLFRGSVAREFVVRLSYEHEDSIWVKRGSFPRALHWGLRELLSCR